ncbi:PPOX class F420-dependent oxidoreductase [Modestobacter roseus]|uniref:Pyridoxamine 5'-phosphate oxidase N-terminal domain-containing protein n=1 Tax=Modestobacter roseus TaxID=1181884 RepID=A0A562IMN6_9ACTN|nr:PPOX class F420-dependent oxidoreductase [Modestobacter roseus]MQA32453.1 PPOX class F420-dependent oxidoreductase [Modestobacter roseus]TWH72281.1 hypothetical protein JD78_00792 [Modestobacter roseus]
MTSLPASRYVSLTTFRRSGEPVSTPVWAAPAGEALVVWTNAGSGKVKRLRDTARVTVAPCDVRGRVEGPAVAATAELLDLAKWPSAARALGRRYGWQWRISYGTGRVVEIVRRRERRAFIRITAAPTPN